MRKTGIMEWVLSAVYPRRCPVCHDIVQPKGELDCSPSDGKNQPEGAPR